MQQIRSPAVAGLFYPDEPAALSRMLDACLSGRADTTPRASPVLVVPHAGLPFSGPVAATAYASLQGTARPRRVILLGPSHRVALSGLALSGASHFRTPLGDMPVDYPELPNSADGFVRPMEIAHQAEHSLEVQLPFLQRLWGPDLPIAPIVVGDGEPGRVGELIGQMLDEPDTLLLVSTDLSHFHDYETARRLDAETVARIESLAGPVTPEQACGCRPLNGLMAYCLAAGRRLMAVDVRNSGDTAGGRERVVGYGAFTLQ